MLRAQDEEGEEDGRPDLVKCFEYCLGLFRLWQTIAMIKIRSKINLLKSAKIG